MLVRFEKTMPCAAEINGVEVKITLLILIDHGAICRKESLNVGAIKSNLDHAHISDKHLSRLLFG